MNFFSIKNTRTNISLEDRQLVGFYIDKENYGLLSLVALQKAIPKSEVMREIIFNYINKNIDIDAVVDSLAKEAYFVFIHKKRNNPTYSLNQCKKELEIDLRGRKVSDGTISCIISKFEMYAQNNTSNSNKQKSK